MKFVFIFGPPAVGKMTVGHELEKLTGFKMFHNHMTVDLVKNFFDIDNPSFGELVSELRIVMLKGLAGSNLSGVIFTAGLDFNEKNELDFVNEIEGIFQKEGAEVYYLELETSLEMRMKRNKSPYRLEQKPTKRDIEESERRLLAFEKSSRFNTRPGEFDKKNYLKVNNTDISASEVARKFKEKFSI